eukprot:245125_1
MAVNNEEEVFDVEPKPYTKQAFDLKESVSDKNTLYLIYGYVHGYIALLRIPTSIIELIIKFYYSKSNIIYIETNYQQVQQPPLMRIVSLDDNKYSECNIQPLSKSNDQIPSQYIESRTAICYVKDFEIPQHILSTHSDKLHENQSYDAMFTVGTNGGGDKGGIIYIFDSSKPFNVYWWKLPNSSYNECAFTTYSEKHELIRIGREFEVLQFNQIQNQWEWKPIVYNLETKRSSLSACMITDYKLFCNGGESISNRGRRSDLRVASKNCDVYDFNSKIWTTLADMNQERACSGIYFEKYIQRVYVGGGYDRGYVYSPTKKFECYDINKNKWMLLSDTNGGHKFNPVIWSENVNIINIASCYYPMFETMDLRENKWRIYAKNNKSFETLFECKNKKSGRLCVI